MNGLRRVQVGFGLLLGLFLLLASQARPAAADLPTNSTSPLGTNLHLVTDWSSEYPFVDAFKASRPWIPQNATVWDTREYNLIDLDEHGWVRSLPAAGSPLQFRYVSTLMFTNMGEHYPAGRYLVLYDGAGTITYGMDAVKNAALSQPGRDVLDVTPGLTNLGILLTITATDPLRTGNYIRNIRVLTPGFDETNYAAQLFHPNFINSIARYRVLRFMDWMRTNLDPNAALRAVWGTALHPLADVERNPYLSLETDTGPLEWESRPLPSDARYSTDAGVPLEVMLELAARIGADPWFNIPHRASNAYIANFATVTRDRLTIEQRVYVEYSNEVWNGSFGQATWVEGKAQQEWPGGGTPTLTKRLNWYGKRTAEICQIWKAVFGGQSDRVICVMATQSNNTWIAQQMLNCPLWSGRPCLQNHGITAVAIAPYFGQHIGQASYAPLVEAWTYLPDGGLHNLFAELANGSQLPNTGGDRTPLTKAKENISSYAALAATYDLELLAYEGGQHLVRMGSSTPTDRLTPLFKAANYDPRMGELYADYFTHWYTAGGTIAVHYTNMGLYSQWGNWGAREYYTQETTPKLDALLEYISAVVCTPSGCREAGTGPTAVAFGKDAAVVASAYLPLWIGFLALATVTARLLRRPTGRR